jgi:hypothetical protein
VPSLILLYLDREATVTRALSNNLEPITRAAGVQKNGVNGAEFLNSTFDYAAGVSRAFTVTRESP